MSISLKLSEIGLKLDSLYNWENMAPIETNYIGAYMYVGGCM